MKEYHYYDLRHEGYSEKYRSGQICVEHGCNEQAGTAWTPYWCPKHDIERKKRITRQMKNILDNW